MKKWVIIGLSVTIVALTVMWYVSPETGKIPPFADVSQILAEDTVISGFERALHPRQFTFPDDLGPHNKFQTEWWYFTGNLNTEKGRAFGYQLTFFRRAIRNQPTIGGSEWRTGQVYMAHFAVSDIESDRFYSFERYSRNSLGLAGATGKPYRVWLENWHIAGDDDDSWNLNAETSTIKLTLRLNPLKPMVFNGNKGLSQKGAQSGNASYYYSNTRIKSNGVLSIKDKIFQVKGFSWLDREWSTSVLSREQIGWDWFAIQFADQREVMLYQIREKDGGLSRFSSGSLIDKKGNKRHLKHNDFNITVLDYWQSPDTKKRYPSAWQVHIPSENLLFSVYPMMKNQEHRLSFAYWEGAVTAKAKGVSGKGYVEMTGYAAQEN